MSLELRKYCIVGGNAVSAFLSWRLQATNACDVTLVWKANFQAVAQYGISFKYVDAIQLFSPDDSGRD
jgi:Ketopantoate reductase PanE/ApbA